MCCSGPDREPYDDPLDYLASGGGGGGGCAHGGYQAPRGMAYHPGGRPKFNADGQEISISNHQAGPMSHSLWQNSQSRSQRGSQQHYGSQHHGSQHHGSQHYGSQHYGSQHHGSQHYSKMPQNHNDHRSSRHSSKAQGFTAYGDEHRASRYKSGAPGTTRRSARPQTLEDLPRRPPSSRQPPGRRAESGRRGPVDTVPNIGSDHTW